MKRNTTILAAKITVGLAVIPILIWAHAAGPDPRHTGAPGDTTCAETGCHVGTALNGGGGSVVLSASSGTTYTPGGGPVTLTITISDSKAKAYGFQLSARVDDNSKFGQAGDFTPGAHQIVLCDDGGLKTSKGCTIPGDPIQFIEHSAPFTQNVMTVSWTPPATDVGTVTLYVGANAANGNLGTQPLGDHIYTTSLQLTPSGGGGNLPAITPGGVVSVSAFNPQAGVAPGTWLEIYGNNLSSTQRSWTVADFRGSNAPTQLDGVAVTIGGKDAFVDFISNGQIDVQVPAGINGPVELVVKNSAGSSQPYSLTATATAPAVLALPQAPFIVNNKQYVVAQLADLTFDGLPSHPAKAGDVITIYAIGFGPVTPAVAPGVITPLPPPALANPVTFLFGDKQASAPFQGMTSGAVGLYQFNVVVPSGLSAGDVPLTVMQNGTKVNQTLFVSVGQ